MSAATAPDDLDALLAAVGDPRRWTWVLDFDGTLSELVDHPGDAMLVDGAADAVTALAEVCEVALLSGRALDDLIARLGTVPPRVLLVGGHGSEARLPDGTRVALTDLDTARSALENLYLRLTSRLDPSSGWLIERKAVSLAVHHRRVPAAQAAALLPWVRSVLEDATTLDPGFALLHGKQVLELKALGVDKGAALAWIDAVSADEAARLPGSPTTPPLVFGDDVTDEDAFTAAVEARGLAVLVDDGTRTPESTAARFRLGRPARVVALLRAVRAPLGTRPVPGPVPDVWDGATPDVAARQP